MQPNHMMLFYVRDPLASAAFYAKVLGAPALESSPGFAMFKLNDGTMLGLWNRAGVAPAPEAAPGASEIGFHVANTADVDRLHDEWRADGTAIVQSPAHMDFGYTFTARDPDGHRLRVFAAA